MRARVLHLHHKALAKLLRLKKEAEAEGACRVARRIHAVVLNHDGLTSGQIADALRAPRSRVSAWVRDYERYGFEGLLEGYRSGRPAKLSSAQHASLCGIIDSGPISYGFFSGVWTSLMITRVIAKEFGVHYHPGHVRKLLRHLGLSVKRPRRALTRANPEKQDKWHRKTCPVPKKRPVPKARH